MTHPGREPPLVVLQRDHRLLARTDDPRWLAARDALRPFAELMRFGGGFATYRLTPLSLWNAAAIGLDAAAMLATLRDLTAAPIMPSTAAFIHETFARTSAIQLRETDEGIALTSADPVLLGTLCERSGVSLTPVVREGDGRGTVLVAPDQRGRLKLAFAALGYPVRDELRIADGAHLPFTLRPDAPELRPYQHASVAAMARAAGGGVILLPCGAGKTLVGIAAAARFQSRTLVLCPGRTNAAQWERAFRVWTDLPPEAVGIFDGSRPRLYPVTIATYQALTARQRGADLPRHLGTFADADWGLVIYDEAHMLPADGFRLSASAAMQSRRRLGLTATLIREDGRETDVFALVGPVLFSRPWRELEAQGWIAPAQCIEVRVPLAPGWPPPGTAIDATAAALNPRKDAVVERLLARHRGAATLVIGGHLDLLHRLARRLRLPLITGDTTTAERERLYAAFRAGAARALVVSSVANQGVDLPGATVAIQVSGHFGSRQEEAQRLGRLLRPNERGAQSVFYTLVTTGTSEVQYARHRRLFLAEQGYAYTVEHAERLLPPRNPGYT
ncbi:MAG: helicase-associated domain-containing protein [Thermomicrobiales bacterium]